MALPTDREFLKVYRLVNECRELGDDAAVWAEHFCRGLQTLLDADIAVSSQLFGPNYTNAQLLGLLDLGWDRGLNREGWRNAVQCFVENPAYHPCMLDGYERAVAGATTMRHLQCYDPDGTWRRSDDFERTTRLMGCDDELFTYLPIATGPDDIQLLVLLRGAGKPHFSEVERRLFGYVADVLRTLIGGALAGYREIRPSELPVRLRTVLACILEGDADKQIASRLDLSVYTVRQYVRQIYRHFHVEGRNELMARWIKRRWGATFAWRSESVPKIIPPKSA